MAQEKDGVHIKRIRIENIRSLEEVEWQVAPENAAGWHVIVGDNGSGKSSFLRSVALALFPQGWGPLRQSTVDWVRRGAKSGRAEVILDRDPGIDHLDSQSKATADGEDHELELPCGFTIRDPSSTKSSSWFENPVPKWDLERGGWFFAAYGPFRRFSGGEDAKVFQSIPRLARCLSIFDERFALSESLAWLEKLKHQSYESTGSAGFLEQLLVFINTPGFLPHGSRLHEISSRGVFFRDGNDFEVPIQELSDGYRSVLSLTLDLIRHLASDFATELIFDCLNPGQVLIPGVVLIDEVDVHLHPTWQRTIGLFFRERFPRMQFLVTSHSPLVCQAASQGTVFLLPKPGSGETGRFVEGTQLDRLVYGNVLDAFSTEIFGRDVTRSDESRVMIQRLAELNRQELEGRLSREERKDQQQLRRQLPSEAYETEPV